MSCSLPSVKQGSAALDLSTRGGLGSPWSSRWGGAPRAVFSAVSAKPQDLRLCRFLQGLARQGELV